MPTKVGMRFTYAQVQYLAGRIGGKSQREAAKAAGYPNVTRRRLHELDNDPALRAYVEDVLAEGGIDLPLLAQKLAEGLNATKIDSFCTKSGEIVQTEPTPDYPTRHKYLTTALDLLGVSTAARKARPQSAQGQAGSVNVLAIVEKYRDISDDELTATLSKMMSGVFPALPSPDTADGKH